MLDEEQNCIQTFIPESINLGFLGTSFSTSSFTDDLSPILLRSASSGIVDCNLYKKIDPIRTKLNYCQIGNDLPSYASLCALDPPTQQYLVESLLPGLRRQSV